MYEYQATLVSVVDGDTIHADLDLGTDVHNFLTLRLYGINAPELPTDAGKTAKAALAGKLPFDHNAITVRTVKDKREKYGRYLATLIVGGVDLNQWMVDNGYAVIYFP
jgi:micrococcal nuclease